MAADANNSRWDFYESLSEVDMLKHLGRYNPTSAPNSKIFPCFFGGIPPKEAMDITPAFYAARTLRSVSITDFFCIVGGAANDFCFILFDGVDSRQKAIGLLHNKEIPGTKLYLREAPSWDSPSLRIAFPEPDVDSDEEFRKIRRACERYRNATNESSTDESSEEENQGTNVTKCKTPPPPDDEEVEGSDGHRPSGKKTVDKAQAEVEMEET